jgi:hypothetical protein
MIESQPFDPDTPFAGRETALAHLHHALNNPQPRHAVVFTGRRYTGKTALLHHARTTFDELDLSLLLTVDAPLTVDENTLLATLYHSLYELVLAAGFSANRLPVLPDEPIPWREWLVQIGLPGLMTVLRGGRRLIVLLDNADELLDVIKAEWLPHDTLNYLQSLLRPQFYLVLTLANEDRLPELSPLVSAEDAFRLRWLTEAEISGLFADAEQARWVHRLTGGYPVLVRRFTAETDMQQAETRVYAASDPIYHELWSTLNQNERLLLTALVSRLYDDPLKSVTAADLESWLVETDYHLDLTAIHAALRSLEYRELLTIDQGQIRLTATLWQKWLLENARLTPVGAPGMGQTSLPQRGLRIAVVVAVMVAAMLLLAVILNLSPDNAPGEVPPTITLAPDATAMP